MAVMPSGAYSNGTDTPAQRMGLAGMHGLQDSPSTLSVQVQGSDYLPMPAMNNPGQLYAAPIK